jgi:Cupin domain
MATLTKEPERPSNLEAARDDFYERLTPVGLAPLWKILSALVTPTPQTPAVAATWAFGRIRPLLMEAGELITAAEAERRVLILENPALPGQSRITSTLYAGLQLILPGEVAPAHRHTQNALRFILEGSGAFTALDGERAYMHKHDLILRSSRCSTPAFQSIAKIAVPGQPLGLREMRECAGAATCALPAPIAPADMATPSSSIPSPSGARRSKPCGAAKPRILMTPI